MAADQVLVASPVDGAVVGTVADQPGVEVVEVVAGLRRAQVEWEALGLPGRTRWVKAYRDWLLDNSDAITRTLQAETGKPWADASLELPSVIDPLNYYVSIAPRLLADRRPQAHGLLTASKRQLLLHRPYAVVGNITPWNFPLTLSLLDSIPRADRGRRRHRQAVRAHADGRDPGDSWRGCQRHRRGPGYGTVSTRGCWCA